jgi:hypothetical protein
VQKIGHGVQPSRGNSQAGFDPPCPNNEVIMNSSGHATFPDRLGPRGKTIIEVDEFNVLRFKNKFLFSAGSNFKLVSGCTLDLWCNLTRGQTEAPYMFAENQKEDGPNQRVSHCVPLPPKLSLPSSWRLPN